VVPDATSGGDGRIPARRRPGLAGKGWGSGVGSSRVRFEAVRRSEDAPAMAGGGGAAVHLPRPQYRWRSGSSSQVRSSGDALVCVRRNRSSWSSSGRNETSSLAAAWPWCPRSRLRTTSPARFANEERGKGCGDRPDF
jgi:hypothetical protein